MDNERYRKILEKITEIAKDVLHMFFEQHILNKKSFKDFLQEIEHLHVIFHAVACYAKDECCQCINSPVLNKFNTTLLQQEFKELYDLNDGKKNKDHHKKDNKRKLLIQDCVCPISVKQNVEIDSMDTNFTCKMIKLCSKSTTPLDPGWLKCIMQTRNDIIHRPAIINKQYFDTTFQEMETIILSIAETVGSVYKKQTEKSIKSSKGDRFTEVQHALEDRITDIDVKKELKELKTLFIGYIDKQKVDLVMNTGQIEKSIESPDNIKVDFTATVNQTHVTADKENEIIENLPPEIKIQTKNDCLSEEAVTETIEITGKKVNSIILELKATPGILHSVENFKAAILTLVRVMQKAGGIDADIEDTVTINLKVESPLTEDQFAVVKCLFAKEWNADNDTTQLPDTIDPLIVKFDRLDVCMSFIKRRIETDDKKVYAEWKMETPDNWNAEKETLVSFVNQWFQIEFVFVALGSLIISTSVSGFVLRQSLHAAIESFLRDFIELCEIDTSIPTILKIEFRVFDNKTSSVQSLISHKDELETSHHCILNEEGCSDTEKSLTPDTEREDSFILEGKQKTLHEKGERRASIGFLDVPKRRSRTRNPRQKLQGDYNINEGSSTQIYRRSRSAVKSLKKSKDMDSDSSNLEEKGCESKTQVSSSKAEIQQSEQDKTEYSHCQASSGSSTQIYRRSQSAGKSLKKSKDTDSGIGSNQEYSHSQASSDPDPHTISETYFYRLCVLLVVIAQDASRKYFSVNILKSESLRNYLERYKHCLFHLYSNMKCCCLKCNNEQTKIFSKEQFDMLFENDRTKIISSHIKKSCGKTDQTCICGIQPKEGIDVDMLDVTLITAIALTCEKDTNTFERFCIETCLGTIEETRNKVFHFSDIKKMSVDVFEYYWQKLSGSVEVICKFINKTYQNKIQKRIQELKSRALVTSDMLKQEELCRAEWRHKCAEFEIIANSELLENEELYANFMTGKAHHEIFTKIDRLNSDIGKTQIHFYGSEKVSQMLDLADPEIYSGKAYIPVLLLLEVPEKWNKQGIMDSAYKIKIAMKQDRNIEIKSCSPEDLNILAYIFWKMFSDIQKLRREMQLFIGSILTFAGINTNKKETMQVCMFINDQHKHAQRRRGSHYISYRNKNIPMF